MVKDTNSQIQEVQRTSKNIQSKENQVRKQTARTKGEGKAETSWKINSYILHTE